MRIFVKYQNARIAVDIQPGDDVKTVKNIIEVKTQLDTHDDKKEGMILDLTYGGASLQDDWILSDIGINSGTTIKGCLKSLNKPKLRVVLGYTDEILEIMDDINPISTPISQIRSIISKQLGLPVTAFRLRLMQAIPRATLPEQEKPKPADTELYDCNTLESYKLETDATVRLEVWDGWKEFINMALLGQVKLAEQYLSYGESERRFQRRVALHIATYFDYTQLAYAMLKAGTRPDLPVGAHPTREWCSESDHVESKKSAVHVACERGNLNVLRMLIKSNVLCLVVRDGNGKTAWEIVVENFHKDCFEYLLARQWGRKSGSDGVSLPILIYCRVMEWCEKARNRVFVMHGQSKSTLRGRPRKNGALVGNGVALDGLNNKKMSSVPLSAMPKPIVSPRRLLPALAKAKRRFRREKSSVVFSQSWGKKSRKRQIFSRETSSHVSLPRSPSSSTSLTEISSNGNVSLVFPPDESLLRQNDRKEMSKSVETLKKFPETLKKRDSTILPTIKAKKHERKSESMLDVEKTSIRSTAPVPTFSRKDAGGEAFYDITKSVIITSAKVAGISLPDNSTPEFRKPFMYWGTSVDMAEEMLSNFEAYRRTSARENAIHCLTLADAFTKKPWLYRADMAARLVRRGVMKSTIVLQ